MADVFNCVDFAIRFFLQSLSFYNCFDHFKQKTRLKLAQFVINVSANPVTLVWNEPLFFGCPQQEKNQEKVCAKIVSRIGGFDKNNFSSFSCLRPQRYSVSINFRLNYVFDGIVGSLFSLRLDFDYNASSMILLYGFDSHMSLYQ